jgi:quercetin dioxygenase-like cupin family protein
MGNSDRFIGINTKDMEWADDTEVLTLPEGVQIKVFSTDPEKGRSDMMVRFPPGYVEPRHAHGGSHSGIIVEGEMHVEGKVLTPGDYVFGPGNNIPHGPMGYPKGCIVFASFTGSPAHSEVTE